MSVLTPLAGAACENASLGFGGALFLAAVAHTVTGRLLVSALAAAIAWPVV